MVRAQTVLVFYWYSDIAKNIATAVLGSRCVSIPVSNTAHITHSEVFVVTDDVHLSQVVSPSTNSMTRSNLLMRNGQATPIPLGGNLSRSMMSSSLQTRPSVPSDQFYDTMEIANPLVVQMESASRRGIQCRRTV